MVQWRTKNKILTVYFGRLFSTNYQCKDYLFVKTCLYLKGDTTNNIEFDCSMINVTFLSIFSMYDVDGNGWIDLPEMTKIVKSIYNMMGPNHVAMDQYESPEARAEGIFRRMDVNSDGKVTRQEFVRCCLEDQKLIELLTPHAAGPAAT